MRKFLLSCLSTAVCLLLSAGAVQAQSLHERADADRDGVVTRPELKKALADRYGNEDANRDGKVTVDEYLRARQKNFDAADTDGNGVVTVEEWVVYWCGKPGGAAGVKEPVRMDRRASRSQRMDADGDGGIRTGECVAFWAGRFIDLDENRDGKLTRGEYIGRMKGMAAIMDLDGDGVITIEEYYISWVGKEQAAGGERKPPAGK